MTFCFRNRWCPMFVLCLSHVWGGHKPAGKHGFTADNDIVGLLSHVSYVFLNLCARRKEKKKVFSLRNINSTAKNMGNMGHRKKHP